MPIPAPTPIPHRPRIAFTAGLLLAACAVLAAPATARTDRSAHLAVTAVDPIDGQPGDPVVIAGAGFGTSPAALFCWADTGAGGFPIEVTAATDPRLDAVVGETPSAATGAVTVWRGQRYPLSDQVVLSQGRLFAATGGELFVRGAGAVGPDFSALSGSPGTSGGPVLQGAIRLELKPDGTTGPPPQKVRVTAVIETSGEESSGTEGLTAPPANVLVVRSGQAEPAWAAILTIEADARPATHEALAAGLAEAMRAQLGSLGLTAHAEGTELVVGHGRGIADGFVNLTGE